MMPVPVNAVKIKLPDILRIVGKWETAASVADGFSQRVIRCDFESIHKEPASFLCINP